MSNILSRLLYIANTTAVLLTLTLVIPAPAAQCHQKKQNDGRYWSWRLVDGKKCWYPGPKFVSKNTLHWASPEERLRTCCWP